MTTIAARVFQNWRVSATQVAFNQVRNASVVCKRLEFREYGDPMEVISKVEEEISDELKPNQVGANVALFSGCDINMPTLLCFADIFIAVSPCHFILIF